jgi:RimJ/RimL family protein N-acetyltransferase
MGATAEVEVGWWVVKELWGRGLASEAGGAALAFGWHRLGLARIKAVAVPENHASIRVMEKLGMRFERRSSTGEWGRPAPHVEVVVYGVDRPAAADGLTVK